MKLGLTSTTFRPYNCDEVIEFALNAGADCIEWGGDVHVKNLDIAKSVKAKCDEKGLEISSFGSYYKLGCCDEAKWREICEITAAMGAKGVRIWFGKKGSAKFTDAEFDTLVQDAKNISTIAKEYDITVAGECHPDTYNDTKETSLKLLKAVDMDNFKTYYQSWYLDMKNDLAVLEDTIDFVNIVHISLSEMKKNQRLRKKDYTCVAQIIEKARELSFDGTYLLEYTKRNKPEYFYGDMKILRHLLTK